MGKLKQYIFSGKNQMNDADNYIRVGGKTLPTLSGKSVTPEELNATVKPDLSQGAKLDGGKPQVSLCPAEAILGMANAFTYGAKKYEAHNFKKGIKYSRLSDAAFRHLIAYMNGEDIDPESGNPHLDHALASLAMLKYMSVNKPEMDDRYKETNND